MIRILTSDDKEHCLQFLKQKAAENLFIIGDIEAFGFDQDFQKIWGEFNQDNQLIAILLKYYSSYIPFAKGPFDAKGFASIMGKDDHFEAMSGLKEVTEAIEPHLKIAKSKRQLYYAKCSQLENNQPVDTSLIELASVADAEGLLRFLKEIPEFANSIQTTIKKKQEDLANGFSRATVIKQDGRIVASASTTAENSASAMIVGVATLQTHKRKGYATACVYQLCSKLFSEGKEACLFYDNPEAGVIYKRIGFEDIDRWVMYQFDKEYVASGI
ncbi:acetyltransferase, GNAT family [Bacillus sp. JCM 19045]|nr:acetyltransferase, GNAT family [Bacillus sp. JCM 19045]